MVMRGHTTDGYAANMGAVQFGDQENLRHSHTRVRVPILSFEMLETHGHGPKPKTSKNTDIT